MKAAFVFGLASLVALAAPLRAVSADDFGMLRHAADMGDGTAQSVLGWKYHTGDGVLQDDREALRLLQASVDSGTAVGMTNLADFYYRGIVVEKNLAKAADLNESAANTKCGASGEQSCKGVLRGKVNLALMLAVGDGRAKDQRRAVELFKEALAAGYEGLDAKIALAGMATNAEGMTPDIPLGLRLYKEAALAGDVESARDLGDIYSKGMYQVPVDLVEARRWYARVASKDPEARHALAQLDAQKPEQPSPRAEVQRLAARASGPATFGAPLVEPARLMALPKDYEGRRVQFSVRASGGLHPVESGLSRVYIDDYEHLTPLLQGAVLRKWLDSGFMPGRVYSVTFVGRLRTKPYGTFVDFEVEDFARN